jgi:capsular exopolysaccharide synthesis family protein
VNNLKPELKIETDILGITGRRGNGELPPTQVGCPPGVQAIQADANFPVLLPPHQSNGDYNNLVVSEAFSVLRSRLLSVHNKLGIKSVVITSAESGDGKTLVSTNIAMSLAQLGNKRILLVDGDLRAGDATRILNLKNLPGVADVLLAKKSFEDAIHVVGFPDLSVAPTGVIPKHALPEILEGPRWAEFLEQAKKRFDLIIVDCLPASAPVADLELVTAPCDAILMVVYMRQTHRAALKRARARLDAKKFLGVVINNCDEIYRYDYSYYGLGSQAHEQPEGETQNRASAISRKSWKTKFR